MKKIYVAFLLMLNLQSINMYAAQESPQDVKPGRQTMIHDAVKNLPYLTKGFDFLQTQNLIDTTFHDFLELNVSHDEHGNEDMNFDQAIIDAEDIITKNMKHPFLKSFDTSIRKNDLDQRDDPVFLYVMQHAADDMHEMTRLWLHEWSNTQDNHGCTPLHYAASFNNVDMAELLINVKANVNIQDEDGNTPLHYISYPYILHILIDAGPDLNIKNKFGETAQQRAKNSGFIDLVIEFNELFEQTQQKQQEKADA